MGISAPIRSFVIHNIYPHMHMYSVKKVDNCEQLENLLCCAPFCIKKEPRGSKLSGAQTATRTLDPHHVTMVL